MLLNWVNNFICILVFEYNFEYRHTEFRCFAMVLHATVHCQPFPKSYAKAYAGT